jgi:hypothetical protein
LKVALEEPQDHDILCESNGFRIALKKGLSSDESRITIDYKKESGFTATLEQR